MSRQKKTTNIEQLAIFDLDNTLLAGDSDHAWGEFVVTKNLVEADQYKQKNDQFYQNYLTGTLDIIAYQSFVLSPLLQFDRKTLYNYVAEFVTTYIKDMILPKAQACIDHHKEQNHTVMIITATNSLLTQPIAQLFGIEHLIATEPAWHETGLSGHIEGIPCYQEGKVKRLRAWLQQHEQSPDLLASAYFYSDSFNDLPLLNQVTFPYAVDPDEALKRHALNNKWPIISFRNTTSH